MSKKTTRNIILILIIILLLAAIIYFLFMFKFPGSTIPQTVNAPKTTAATTSQQNLLPATTTRDVTVKAKNDQPASSDTIAQTNLEKIAKSFAERLGSYSNQSNFSNISDLKVLMTPSMQAWADKYVLANQKAAYSGIYQGVTTHAISDTITNYDDAKGQADILVNTQKVTVTGTSSPVTTYQDITISFVKKNNNWLVDNAVWKK